MRIGRRILRILRAHFFTAGHCVPIEAREAFVLGLQSSKAFDEGYRSGFSAGRADGERAGYEQGAYDTRFAQQMAQAYEKVPGKLVDCKVFNDREQLIGTFDAAGNYHPCPRAIPVLRRHANRT